MSKSKIEWTDETWNPVTGCTKVSLGCKNCYAEREWPRMVRLVPSYAGRKFTDVRTHADRLDKPLRWKHPRRVFVNSMSDLFHPDVPDGFIDQVFAVMALSQQHTFQILTKRPERMQKYISSLSPERIADAVPRGGWNITKHHAVAKITSQPKAAAEMYRCERLSWPLPNVWLGVSVENQETADERIPLLLQTPAAVRWISAEPLLGFVDLNYAFGIPTGAGRGSCPMHLAGVCPEGLLPLGQQHLHWVVVGGESGPNARPMNPAWVRSIRDQCVSAGVAFLFKQWGEWGDPASIEAVGTAHNGWWEVDPEDGGVRRHEFDNQNEVFRVGKKHAGRLLDGVQHDGYPA